MAGYWVVVNTRDVPGWTPEKAVDMVLGKWMPGEPPQWLFDRSPKGGRPNNFARVEIGDRVLLFNGIKSDEPKKSFLAHATVTGKADRAGPEQDRYQLQFGVPLGRLNPVSLDALRSSTNPSILPGEFRVLFKGHQHGPLDDLGIDPVGPRPIGSVVDAGLASRRWQIILQVGEGVVFP